MDHLHHQHIHPSQAAIMEPTELGSMKMYLHFGLGDLFLVRGFVLDSTARLVFACVLAFICALLLAATDHARLYLSCWCHKPAASNPGRARSVSSELGSVGVPKAEAPCCERPRATPERRSFLTSPLVSSGGVPPIKIRLLQAALHFVRTGLALGLMLVAMTYNVCLIFAIALGAALGLFAFARASSHVTGVCH